MNTMKRIVGVTAAASAAMLLAAGCTSSNDDAPDPGSSTAAATSSAESGADGSKAQSLVLTQKDLPAGYQVMEVPKGELEKVAGSFSTGIKTAKVTPAGCAQLSAFPDKIEVDEIGYLIGMRTTSVLAQTVSVSGRSVDSARKAATGKCAKQSIEITDGPAAGAKATATSKVISAPKTKADDAVVIQQKATIVMNDVKTSSTVIVGLAEVDGYLVSVQASDASPGGTPDLAAFNAFFTKAIDRVDAST